MTAYIMMPKSIKLLTSSIKTVKEKITASKPNH